MKRVLIFVFLMVFLLGSSVSAIEKKETRQATQKEVDKKHITKPGKGAQSGTLKSHNQKQPKRDYNDFVDRNNNGIDDRIESRKKKAGIEKKPVDKSVKKKETKPKSK